MGDAPICQNAEWMTPESGKTMKERVIRNIAKIFCDAFGLKETKVVFAKKDGAIVTDAEKILNNPNALWELTIDPDNFLYKSHDPRYFASLVGAIAHELQHQRQLVQLLENRYIDKIDGKDQDVLIPSPLAGNASARLNSGVDELADYMVQPIELQAHLVHKHVMKAMRAMSKARGKGAK